VNSDELGKDLEHVEVLQAKFIDLQKDLLANEVRLNNVSEMAEVMIKEGHPDTDTIQHEVEVYFYLNDATLKLSFCTIYFRLFLATGNHYWPCLKVERRP